MNEEREFMYKIGEASLYRVKDKLLGYRIALIDGKKELLFDNEKEMRKHFKHEDRYPLS